MDRVITVKKHNGGTENFDTDKILRVVRIAAKRANYKITDDDISKVVDSVNDKLEMSDGDLELTSSDIDNMVIKVLEKVDPLLYYEYMSYKNYKKDLQRHSNLVHDFINESDALSFSNEDDFANLIIKDIKTIIRRYGSIEVPSYLVLDTLVMISIKDDNQSVASLLTLDTGLSFLTDVIQLCKDQLYEELTMEDEDEE